MNFNGLRRDLSPFGSCSMKAESHFFGSVIDHAGCLRIGQNPCSVWCHNPTVMTRMIFSRTKKDEFAVHDLALAFHPSAQCADETAPGGGPLL